MSKALAIKNKPKVCLVCLSKIKADNVAPISPPRRYAYLCLFGSSFLLSPHTIHLNKAKNAKINSPNLIESLPIKPSTIFLGYLRIFLIPKTVVIPAFIK